MKQKIRKTSKTILFTCLVGIVVLVILILREKNNVDDESLAQIDEIKETSINLGYDMYITEVGKYDGVYMEDGSDERVSDILMITVKNEGVNAIQYAEISMPVGEKTASFALSTLPPNSTIIVLEKNRMSYEKADYTTAIAENVAIFSEPLNLCEDRLKIQCLDGIMNVSNISGEDIEEDIVIYYKNSATDVLYGGITYRLRVENGLKNGEIRQIAASHFSESGSRIMFVTCGAE